MMKKQFGEYYLGLDMGTNSVGWAITDLQYNILKFKGKSLWGVRLFDEASTAKERRTFRSARRRLERKKWRIKLLESLFAEEITKVDPGFYRRLRESNLYLEDKSQDNKQKFNLFKDATFTDKEFHEQYPTIYHLRNSLLDSTKTFDVRLVFLAIANILKYRGHFLFEGINAEGIQDFDKTFTNVKMFVQDNVDGLENWDCASIEQLQKILKSKQLSINGKKKALCQQCNAKTPQEKAIVALFAGGTIQLADLFDDEELKNAEKPKISFKEDFDAIKPELEGILGARLELIEKIKTLYDWAILAEILHGEKYISKAKIAVYDEHQQDLKDLKAIVRKYIPKEYKEIFGKPTGKTIANYSSYVGMFKINGKKGVIEKKCNQEELCKFLNSKLSCIDNSSDKVLQHIREKISLNFFLPRQVTKSNGVIPMQINRAELVKILDNASKYLPFLNNVEDGITIREKIVSIMDFKIPYYVGPLNGIPQHYMKKDTKQIQSTGHDNSKWWVVRNSSEKIFPWNFSKVINKEESANKFIRRMTNKCTYLPTEDVLPKNSLLYSEFVVRNEINNIKLNAEPLSAEIKNKIFEKLFQQKSSKVTNKKIVDFLIVENIIPKNSDVSVISGIDTELKGRLRSYHDFKKIFGDKVEVKKEEIEQIILWLTVFNEEKDMVKSKIKEYYTEISKDDINKICHFSYEGWGTLSQELLCGKSIKYIDESTGEGLGIINTMRETGNNLMEILDSHNKYKFKEKIDSFNNMSGADNFELNYATVDKLYVSPVVKRQIWQTLVVVKELQKIMGHDPKKIFVEMARQEGTKKKTKSRKERLLELYKSCKKDVQEWLGDKDWEEEIQNKTDSQLKSEKLFLYYCQMGRDMYTSESIDINDLMSGGNKWDKDHIYPRSKTKDDSFDNLVLVNKVANAHKTDSYPIEVSIQHTNMPFWNILLKKGFISQKKYERLTRTTHLSSEELAGFIARQLVETRQSTKAATQILGSVFSNTDIVYAKAGNASDFKNLKEKYDDNGKKVEQQIPEFIKVREVNDFHHAKDAYINIVVGNVYDTKFTKNVLKYVQSGAKYTLNPEKLYQREITAAWIPGPDGTVSTVRKYMRKNDVLFTRYAYEGKGALYKLQPVKKGVGQIPLKENKPIEKYGGYTDPTTAYFMLVESTGKKNSKTRTIEAVPNYLAAEFKDNENARTEFCIHKLNLQNPRIIIPIIKLKSLLRINGFYVHIAGKSNDQLVVWGAEELILPLKEYSYVKKIAKYCAKNKKASSQNGYLRITKFDGINKEENNNLYEVLLKKHETTIFKNRPNGQIENLRKAEGKFAELSLEEQCLELNEILHLFQCSAATTINLEYMMGKGKCKTLGKMTVSKNISKYERAEIINQSPTGLFEQSIDLLNPNL